jgi:ceramide glucosyltransferase
MAQCLAGWFFVGRFARWLRRGGVPAELPPLTLLTPLSGAEPLLEETLASGCRQDYPGLRIVYGVHRADDPAVAVVERVRARFPEREIALVVDARLHGINRKIGNLINMLEATPDRGADEILAFADSDMILAQGHLRAVAAALAAPGVGLATTVYGARATARGLAGWLGCTGLMHGFLPGVLMGRAMGRQDNLGATMALTRGTLAGVGGLAAVAGHVADDNELSRLVRGRGLATVLARTLPVTTVREARVGDLLRHELRWARTIRALVPGAFALSAVQFPLAWALLALALAPGPGMATLFVMAWAVRMAAARGIDRALGLVAEGAATRVPGIVLPLRDVLSVGLVAASFAGSRVVWRGVAMRVAPPGK